jgi:hypothetical protein
MESIFTLEPVEHLKDVMLALIDKTLTDAAGIAARSATASDPVASQLLLCLEALATVDNDALLDLAQPLVPYICQLEFAFLKLARQAFGQHCVTHRLDERTMDMSFEGADIEQLPGEMTGEVLRYFSAEPAVMNGRYFDYEPINKSVLMQRAFRAGLHDIVLRHVRFVPLAAPTPVAMPAALTATLAATLAATPRYATPQHATPTGLPPPMPTGLSAAPPLPLGLPPMPSPMFSAHARDEVPPFPTEAYSPAGPPPPLLQSPLNKAGIDAALSLESLRIAPLPDTVSAAPSPMVHEHIVRHVAAAPSPGRPNRSRRRSRRDEWVPH